MTKKEALKRAFKELVEARNNLRNGQKNRVPTDQEAALREKVAYRETVVEALRPAHIDQEVWGCPYCTPDAEGYVRKFGAFSLHNGMLGTGHCKAVEIKYCPECARPLNGAAASELKERLRG